MNSRKRFIIAMTGGRADRVPCTPDISNMIPCRLTGKPFWDIYLYNQPPLWKAYLDAVSYFGIDAWNVYATLDFQYKEIVRRESKIISRTDERIVQRTQIITPDGEMIQEVVFLKADSPSPTVKPVKDIQKDFAKMRHLYRMPTGYSTESALEQKHIIGDKYAFGAQIIYPGFHIWMNIIQGGVEPLAYAEVDCPELLEELRELHEKMVLKEVEMIIYSGLFDYLLLSASGSITLASPGLFDKYALPTIKKVTRMCKQAGMPTMLHSCGKQMHLIKRCAEETDLDCINPLEMPPMGDCDLAEVKQIYGDRLALMGNLHTIDIMFNGSPADVERSAKKCIEDAAAGGGFILSTGDQCGRDTPDENIRRMIEVARTYGKY